MTTYTLNQLTGVITNNDDGSIIPQDDSTLAYQNYAAWLAAGNTPIIDNTPPDSSNPDNPNEGVSKLDFINRFTDDEYGAVLTLAETMMGVKIYLNKLDLTTPDQNGWSLYLTDARTIEGVQAVCAILEQTGFYTTPGQGAIRAAEVLSFTTPPLNR